MDSNAPKAAEGSAPNAPNPGKTPLGGKGAAPAPAAGGKDAMRDHLSTIAMAVVIVAALVMVVVLQLRKDSHFNDEAWTQLSAVRQKSEGVDGFAELAQKYRGSDADPFIRLAWAARLYEGGRRDQVEEAKALLEQVQRESSGNAFLKDRIAEQLKNINAELTDPRAKLAVAGEAAAVSTASGGLPLEMPDEHGPDDGHGH